MAATTRTDTSRVALMAGAIGLLAVAFALVGVDLGRRILGSNDEARFAVLGQAVLARGEWLFPRLGGEVYHNKPLLLAWLIALVSWPFGRVTQLTAVLPSAAAAVATTLAVYGFGRRLFDRRAALYAALATLTTQGVFVHARVPLPDMLMTAFTTLAVWMLWELDRGDRRAWLGFYALAAAAFWAKGPAGLILPLAVAVAQAVVSRSPDAWRRLDLRRGFLIVAALVGPWWLVSLGADAPAMGRIVLYDQVLWYVPRRLHWGSLLDPLDHLVGVLFPWLLALPAALAAATPLIRGRRPGGHALRFLVVAAAAMVVVLAVSRAQRFRYYVPVAPLAGLLVGWWCADGAPRPAPRTLARLYVALAGVLGVAAAAVPLLGERWPGTLDLPVSPAQAGALGAMLAVMVAALAAGMLRNRLAHTFAAAWLASAAFVVADYHWEMASHNGAHDYPRVREQMVRRLPEARLVASWGLYAIPLAFYFDQPVAAVETDADLGRITGADPRGVAILTDGALASVRDRQRLRVLLRDRLGPLGVSVVNYSGDPASPTAWRP